MTAFLSLQTQYENLGDEVINAMMLRELCARMDVVASGDGIPAWYIANLRDTLGPLQDRLHIVSKAAFYGKLLQSGVQLRGRSFLFTSCGDVSGKTSNYRRDGILALLQFLPALRLGLVGASYSAVSTSKARLLRLAAGRSASLAVRDRRSQAVLAAKSVTLPVVPDLAFLLPMAPTPITAGARDLALFQMRDIKDTEIGILLPRLERLAGDARAAGLTPGIAWQVGRDEAISLQLAKALDLPVLTPAEAQQSRLQALNGLYDRTAVIYSNRLHGLLVAAARGALPLALLHDKESKIRGIFEDAGLTELILSITGTQPFPITAPERAVALAKVAQVFTASAEDLRRFFDGLAPSAVRAAGDA